MSIIRTMPKPGKGFLNFDVPFKCHCGADRKLWFSGYNMALPIPGKPQRAHCPDCGRDFTYALKDVNDRLEVHLEIADAMV